MVARGLLERVTQRNVIVATLGGFGADLICQGVIEKCPIENIDKRRLFAMTVFSGTYIGLVAGKVYNVYPMLARKLSTRLSPSSKAWLGVKNSNPTGSKFEVALSWVVDNFLHVPLLYTPSYFLAVGAMQGDSLSKSIETCKRDWWPTLTSCWVFWGPVMYINFTFVPPPLRVQVVGTANFVWTVLLDYLTHEKSHRECDSHNTKRVLEQQQSESVPSPTAKSMTSGDRSVFLYSKQEDNDLKDLIVEPQQQTTDE